MQERSLYALRARQDGRRMGIGWMVANARHRYTNYEEVIASLGPRGVNDELKARIREEVNKRLSQLLAIPFSDENDPGDE